MMNARNAKKHLPDLLAGLRLSPVERVGNHLTDEEIVGYMLIEEHIATCPDCAKELEQMTEANERWRTPEADSRRLQSLNRLKEFLSSESVQRSLPSPVKAPEPQAYTGLIVNDRETPAALRPAPSQQTAGPVVAIDIGSSKVGVLIAQVDNRGGLEIIGKGLASNRGTRRGNVVNVEATVDAIKAAVEEAEVMAGVEILRAYVGIAGSDVRSENSRGTVSVASKNREITRSDIQRVLDAAKSMSLPPDRELLHCVPQEFIVDEQGQIGDPLGVLGTRLEAMVHLVTCNVARLRTLLTCVNRAGIEVLEMVFEPIATAEAVLTADERELGVLLMDIGASTTEYAFFFDGEIQYSGVAPIGAGHFTNDLAMVLRTPFIEAERIKIKHGCCLPSLVIEDEGIAVPTVAGGTPHIIPKREICEILQPRAEELLNLLRADLIKHIPDPALRGGIVLTGGGAQLEGILEMTEQIFNTSVRYGLPRGIRGLIDVISSPIWSTASGILIYALAAEEAKAQQRKRSARSGRGLISFFRNIFIYLFK